MLPRVRRLSARAVRLVLKEGKRARGAFLSARFVKASQGEEAFAAVVSGRIAKTAVRRNKLRRFLYREIALLSPSGLKAALILEKLPQEKEEELLKEDLKAVFGKSRT